MTTVVCNGAHGDREVARRDYVEDGTADNIRRGNKSQQGLHVSAPGGGGPSLKTSVLRVMRLELAGQESTLASHLVASPL